MSGASSAIVDGAAVQPIKPRIIFELPELVLEKIFMYLDTESLAAVTSLHPRLRQARQAMTEVRIRTTSLCARIHRMVTMNPRNVIVLDLANCDTASSRMRRLIKQCRRLNQLNVVNSALTNEDLVICLRALRQLESVSFSTFRLPRGVLCTEDWPNIKRVSVECIRISFPFAMEVINRCSELRHLRMVFLDIENDPQGGNFGACARVHHRLWRNLETVIVNFCQPYWFREAVFRLVFGSRPLSHHVQFRDFEQFKLTFAYDRGNFNLRNPTKVVALTEESILSKMYLVNPEQMEQRGEPIWHYGQPRRLFVDESRDDAPCEKLPSSIFMLTTLVHLTVHDCFVETPRQSWEKLFRSSSALESLSAPFCFLSRGGHFDFHRPYYPIMESLGALKLKKLTLYPKCLHSDSEHELTWTRPRLESLRHLEQLTLLDPPEDRNIWIDVGNSNVRIVKVSVLRTTRLDLRKFHEFFTLCKNLKYFKFRARALPLHSPFLWFGPSRANLKQLCFSTETSQEVVSLGLMQCVLPELCTNLEVFHVHAPGLPNGKAFTALVEKKIAEINLGRGENPVRSLILTGRQADQIGARFFFANFPGRSLCCMDEDLTRDLDGWEIM